MERLVITIHSGASDQALLLVADAMQQVLDLVKLHDEAGRALASPDGAFEWRLEHASANSPFTVTAVAEPVDPTTDVSEQVQRVKAEVRRGIRGLVQDREVAWWMGPEAMRLTRSVFGRIQNGISSTEIGFAPDEAFSLSKADADAGIRAISGITAIALGADLGERMAFGEIQGVMVAAGRYRNRPAIQIRAELYGFVWCQLSAEITERFGDEHRMRDVWEGRALGIQGRLIYGAGGKLSRIEVTDIREIEAAPLLDLDSVLDPGFTAGLDPVEYLRQLHEGELA